MNGPAHSGWLNHGLAAGLALSATWLFVGQLDRNGPEQDRVTDRRAIDYPLHGHLLNHGTEPFLAAALAHTFSDGSSIVLMGSSELSTSDHPSKPVNFFNKELHVPLLALGHDGNQSFSIHAQLIATGADLRNARLAILVSPGWFVDKPGLRGTALASFLEYQPSPSLYRIQQRIEQGDPVTMPVSAYMAEHEPELGAAQPITQWITRDASITGRFLYAFSQPWNAAIIQRTRSSMLAEDRLRPWNPGTRAVFDADEWQPLYAMSAKEHMAQCSNNSVFVYDAYYAEHVKGRTRTLDIPPMERNRELRDFIALLDYLKTVHARPYFIIQPLNPYVYTNVKELDPLMARIRQELDGRQFSYLDLWVSDTSHFKPGTLTDVMHLGPLGWYRVDSAMASYFP